jgi:hypothetical protein
MAEANIYNKIKAPVVTLEGYKPIDQKIPLKKVKERFNDLVRKVEYAEIEALAVVGLPFSKDGERLYQIYVKPMPIE